MTEHCINILAYDLVLNLKILRLLLKRTQVCIEYQHVKNRIYYYFYRLLVFIKRDSLKLKKIDLSLGDLYDDNSNLGMKLEFDLPETAENILGDIKNYDALKIIPERIKPECHLYIKKCVNEEIRPIIGLYLILNWRLAHQKEDVLLLLPYSPIIRLLDKYQNKYDVKVIFYRQKVLLSRLRRIISYYIRYGYFIIGENGSAGCNIGVKYSEGLDLSKRSDIFWLRGIKKFSKNILIYQFLSRDYKKILILKKLGFRVNIKIINPFKRYPEANQIKNLKNLIQNYRKQHGVSGKLESWLIWILDTFLTETRRWIKFIQSNGIKILFELDGPNSLVCQKAALNLSNSLSLGAQRSCITMDSFQPFLHYSTSDIFFTWGWEFNWHQHTSQLIEQFVVTGYPFNVRHNKNDAPTIPASSTALRVALFDNGFSNVACYSKSMMENYYQAFLNWLVEDESIQIIVKSKRNDLIEQLDNIKGLYHYALDTGRLFRLNDEEGRFPSDAAQYADIAVGIGISSAVLESVIHGCRGIHCDLVGFNYHPYYQIGFKRLVFNDINSLIDTLKIYKQNNSKVRELGDWSKYIQIVEPYRDGQGDRRIGQYMEWLLEYFNRGGSKEGAVQFANKAYESQWGSDMIKPNKEHGVVDCRT